MKRFAQLFLVFFLALACQAQPQVKYVFYFIGDGMGVNHVMGTEQYNQATGKGPASINFNHFPVRGFITTVSGSSLVTDSAAGGTALATGVKTYNDAEGVDLAGNPVSSIVEWAHAAGCGTGVATSVGVNHATPAAFLTHTASRHDTDDIALQEIDGFVDFLAGGWFIVRRQSGHGRPFYEKRSRDAGITIFRGPSFPDVADAPGRVLCFSGKPQSDIPYAIDRQEDDTRLADFVQAGIGYLEKHFADQGFFFMIEGGKIDYAGHANDAATTFQEVSDMAESVDLALSFLNRHPDETLIVVTADHETGGLLLGSDAYEMHPERMAWQQASATALTRLFRETFSPEGKPYKAPSWESVKAFFAAQLGLWEHVPVSAADEAALKEVYEKTFGKGGDRNLGKANLYSVNARMVDDALRVLDRSAGFHFSYGTHSGSPVGLYVTGTGCEVFNSVKDNAEIAPLIRQLAGY